MKRQNLISRILTSHAFSCATILFLILMGPALMAVDLTYLSDWVNSYRMGDFYVYIAFIGVTSLWSIFGFIMALTKSVGGVTIFMVGLVIINFIHFIVGMVHVILLFTSYKYILMDTCLQRDPSRFFWWDLGFKENDDMRRVRAACESEWKSFSTERIASWLAYTVLSFICVYIIFRFQRRLTADRRHRKLVSSDDHSDQWSDDDNTANEKQNSAGNITYHENQESGNKKSDFSNMMHRQRQKLFDEIAKRKRARKNINRRTIVTNPDRNSVLVVHPLDLSKDPEVYTPPPMPPSNSENNNGEQSESWNRYKGSGNGGGNNDSVTLQDDEEMIERQKRLDQLSSERIDYEMYRSDEASNFANKQKPDEVEHGQDNDDNQQWTTVSGASVRKRPKSGRWANITDNKNMYKPLASATPHNEDDSEYEDTVDQQLMDPGHD